MCHWFADEQLVNEQISHHYEFALLALSRCHAHQWKVKSETESGAGRCRVNLEPVTEIDKVPNHGKHPMILVYPL